MNVCVCECACMHVYIHSFISIGAWSSLDRVCCVRVDNKPAIQWTVQACYSASLLQWTVQACDSASLLQWTVQACASLQQWTVQASSLLQWTVQACYSASLLQWTVQGYTFVGLARTIYIRCIYGIFGREITKYTVIYSVNLRFWATLHI